MGKTTLSPFQQKIYEMYTSEKKYVLTSKSYGKTFYWKKYLQEHPEVAKKLSIKVETK